MKEGYRSGRPKIYGSYGSGSGTLLETIVQTHSERSNYSTSFVLYNLRNLYIHLEPDFLKKYSENCLNPHLPKSLSGSAKKIILI
jgi:hypothetical protein